jgi:hypothetical protein
MDELAPYFLLIIIKVTLIFAGAYLLYLHNKSKAIEEISLDKDTILRKKILLARRVSQYHWYFLIIICFLSISMNWGNEPGSGGGIALFLFIIWLIIVWPVIYFWKKNYTNPANTIDISSLTRRDELLKYLFVEANKQYKKGINIFLLISLIGPIFCAIFPSLIGETEAAAGFGNSLFFLLFITLLVWITSLFQKRKNNKIKNYYLSNKACEIWASEDSENSLHIKFDNKEIEIGKLFLPFSIENCIKIINYDNIQVPAQVEEEKIEINQKISPDVVPNDKNNDSIIAEISDKYESKKTYNLTFLILFSIIFLPLGLILSFI